MIGADRGGETMHCLSAPLTRLTKGERASAYSTNTHGDRVYVNQDETNTICSPIWSNRFIEPSYT
jgi:hypothetical protein